jgi:cell division protein FtsB
MTHKKGIGFYMLSKQIKKGAIISLVASSVLFMGVATSWSQEVKAEITVQSQEYALREANNYLLACTRKYGQLRELVNKLVAENKKLKAGLKKAGLEKASE